MRFLVAEIQAVKATLQRQWDRIGECAYCWKHAPLWRKPTGYHICRSCLYKQLDTANMNIFKAQLPVG